MNLNILAQMYNDHKTFGVTGLRLTYYSQGDALEIEARCTDDSEPYWDFVSIEPYSPEQYIDLLTHIVNGEFIDENGEKYTVICRVLE